jgi:hypothetical protein
MPKDEEQETPRYATVMLETRVAKVNMQRQDDYEFEADDVEARIHGDYIIIEKKDTDEMLAIIPKDNVMIVQLETREFEATVQVDADGNPITEPEEVPDSIEVPEGTTLQLEAEEQADDGKTSPKD